MFTSQCLLSVTVISLLPFCQHSCLSSKVISIILSMTAIVMITLNWESLEAEARLAPSSVCFCINASSLWVVVSYLTNSRRPVWVGSGAGETWPTRRKTSSDYFLKACFSAQRQESKSPAESRPAIYPPVYLAWTLLQRIWGVLCE